MGGRGPTVLGRLLRRRRARRSRVLRAVDPRPMSESDLIDVSFDFRSDTPGYGLPRVDPDASSPTLRRYHQLLWSKRLPSGAPFLLDVTTPGAYLHHLSPLGEFRLSSDAVIPTLRKKLARVIE